MMKIQEKESIIRELECIADLTRLDVFTGEDRVYLSKEERELCKACDETCALLMGKKTNDIPISKLILTLEKTEESLKSSISERAAFMEEQGINHESVQDLEIGNLNGIKGALEYLKQEELKKIKAERE